MSIWCYEPMSCRLCQKKLTATVSDDSAVGRASCYSDCIYKCSFCGVGYSNARHEADRRLIWDDYSKNVPTEVRDDLATVLSRSLNVRNQKSKLHKFASEKSEDAVTWTIFRHLLATKLIGTALAMNGFKPHALWFWGTRWPLELQSDDLRSQLETILSKHMHEFRNSMSEPDLIMEDATRLVFVEVKYFSENDCKPNYKGFSRYLAQASHLFQNCDAVAKAGHYELVRNWVVGASLAKERNKCFTLINLAGDSCRTSAEAFARSLVQSPERNFKFVTWNEAVNRLQPPLAPWFASYLHQRKLGE